MQDGDLTSGDVAKLSTTAELMEKEWAPCRYNCPVHADVRAYVELIALGQWQAAIDVIRARLPFTSVCGRICHHPCEANCRRADVDDPVAIREVKRFVSEKQGASGATVNKVTQDKAKVAIVGAGPAGMSAALELAKLGYRPTVFEKSDVAGGIPATAIPVYRLPRDVIQQDVDWICAHGVQLVTGCEIGKDKTIEQLRLDGFEAVVVAAGLAQSRTLKMPGADNPRVLRVLEFLTDAVYGRKPDIGQNVLVIGGGNVAMDAARTAVRLGAKAVTAMCLENEQEIPAFEWEVSEAVEEGVRIIHRRGPVEIFVKGGKITGLKSRKVTRVFDDQDRFSPEYDDSDMQDVQCDTVIFAIGQMADFGFVEGSGLELDKGTRLTCNPLTHETSVAGVFACGEIVTPPGSVVEACASGQRAAQAVHMYLTGEPIRIDDELPPYIEKLPEATAELVKKVERRPVPIEAPEVRAKVFTEVDHNYSDETAMGESRRCMGCGSGAEVLVDKCVACLTCLRVCPFDIPKVTDVARIESILCQACGMCIAECPGNAIVAKGWDVKGLVDQTRQRLADLPQSDGRIIAYVCGHHSSADELTGAAKDAAAGVSEFYLPSMSRLAAADILHAIENGARGVIVVNCRSGSERYPTVAERIGKRVTQARELVGEVGLDPDIIQIVDEASQGRSAIKDAVAQAAEKIAACK